MAAIDEEQKVTTSTFDWAALVKEKWGAEWVKPEVVYKFSNGREFLSTDKAETGIYRRT